MRQPLTERGVAAVLARVFPRRSNYVPVKYNELLEEALHFEVRTMAAYQRLMKRHRRRVIYIDQSPLDALNARIYRGELGDAEFATRIRLHRWFHWEGLARIAFELEFGDAYEKYVERRYADERRDAI